MSSQRLSPLLALLTIAILVFAATAALSLTASYDLSLSQATTAAVIASVGIYLIVSNLRAGLRLLGIVVVAVGFLFTLFFISQFAHQAYIETPEVVNRLGALTTLLPPAGVYIHQNSAATLLDMLLPLALGMLLLSRSAAARAGWGVVVLVILYALLLTYSRGAWVGLVLAAIVGAVAFGLRRLSRGKVIAIVTGSALLIMVALVVLLTVGTQVSFVQNALVTLNSRLELYRNSLFLVSDYPFTGIGAGSTFAMVYSRFSLLIFVPFLTYVHNLPLAVWLGQGIGGFIAFALAIVMFYAYVVQVLRKAEPNALFHGAWLGVTATLLHGLVDARQYVESPLNMPLLLVGMALAVATGRQALHEVADAGSQSWSWRPLLAGAGLLIVLLVVGFVVFRQPLTAAWYTNQGAIAETRADGVILPDLSEADRDAGVLSARQWYEQALSIDPNYPNANRRLGNMLVGQDEFEPAVPLLEKAYAAEPTYRATIKGLGLAYTWVGRTGEAACTFKHLTDVGEMINELYNWQNFRYEQKQVLLSAYALESAAILEDYQQTNMDVWVLIGDRFREAGELERAFMWYTFVLEKAPDSLSAQEQSQALIKELFPEAGEQDNLNLLIRKPALIDCEQLQ